MDWESTFGGFVIGFMAFAICMLGITQCWPEKSLLYQQGVKSVNKEAFEKGFMRKEVDKDDKVIYKWVELEKAL